MRTITTERIPILVWGESADEPTLAQARNIANLPFAFRHVALMPDAHVGYGVPIGGVFATRGQVVPHAVGLDIGCGVRGWRTNVSATKLLRKRDEILGDIQRSVPQGPDWHALSQAHQTTIFDNVPDIAPLRAECAKAARQVGTMGGGNHFIELSVDPGGIVWAMVHSGSRNVGKLMAEYYDEVARTESKLGNSPVPPEWGLAHLPTDHEAGAEYLVVMNWCLSFARESRRLMADKVQEAISRRFRAEEPDPQLDVHHNYAAVETHFGEEVVVHRKGAVRAVGRVLVPGSMGTASYVGEGLANPDAFESCAHGAGRAMGRKAAMRSLPREQVLSELDERDVRLFKAKKRDVAEEAPEAYKDIDEVMVAQRDLVEARVRLTPIGVVKG